MVAGMSAGGETSLLRVLFGFVSDPVCICQDFEKYFSGFGQFMASPTDLIKTQIQMEGRRRLLGYEARVEGTADAFRFSLR